MMVHEHCAGPAACVAFWFTCAMLFVSTAAAINMDTTAPIVDLGYAQYKGYFDKQANITSFLSIRYAAPPIGRLRFQAPQPPIPETGVQLAAQNPNMCHQALYGFNTTMLIPKVQISQPHPESGVESATHNEEYQVSFDVERSVAASDDKPQTATTQDASEDCLFLNVFVPGTMPAESVTSRGLPVLVWIHGGGYQLGGATQYNGAELLTASLNTMVIVVIQYRLGAFGFLSGNEVKENGALNAGLLDQRFALQWVQDHIASFGGDKAHVTIWGESAGGGSVLQHIIANGGNTQPPLFNAAITSSTYLPPQHHYNDRVPESQYDRVVALSGCASSANTFKCLQSATAETLQKANYDIAFGALYGTFTFVPVVDGTFILERPTIALANGQVNGKILLAVTNQNEGNIFVFENMSSSIPDYISLLFPDMTSTSIQEAALVYQGYGTAYEQAMTVMGDAIFVCPTYHLLEAFPGRSWKSLFAILPALHTQDVKYYFPSYDNQFIPPRINNTRFITAFSQSFMSLAKYNDVNVKLDPSSMTPDWDTYDVGGMEMLFNFTEAGEPVVSSNETDESLLQHISVMGDMEMLFSPAETGDPVVLPIKTDVKLQQRCAFWKKVTSETAQ